MDTSSTLKTVGATLAELAPTILAATGSAASPQTAAIIALAPIALQFLQSATQLQQAGAMTAEQLAGLFATVGQGVQSTHDKWVAMNAADAAKNVPATVAHQAA